MIPSENPPSIGSSFSIMMVAISVSRFPTGPNDLEEKKQRMRTRMRKRMRKRTRRTRREGSHCSIMIIAISVSRFPTDLNDLEENVTYRLYLH